MVVPRIVDRVCVGHVGQVEDSWRLWAHGDVAERDAVLREENQLHKDKENKEQNAGIQQ